MLHTWLGHHKPPIEKTTFYDGFIYSLTKIMYINNDFEVIKHVGRIFFNSSVKQLISNKQLQKI